MRLLLCLVQRVGFVPKGEQLVFKRTRRVGIAFAVDLRMLLEPFLGEVDLGERLNPVGLSRIGGKVRAKFVFLLVLRVIGPVAGIVRRPPVVLENRVLRRFGPVFKNPIRVLYPMRRLAVFNSGASDVFAVNVVAKECYWNQLAAQFDAVVTALRVVFFDRRKLALERVLIVFRMIRSAGLRLLHFFALILSHQPINFLK